MNEIPLVALSPDIAFLPSTAAVAIKRAVCANPAAGTAFRQDGIALPLRPAISSSFPDEFQVIQRIGAALRRKTAAMTCRARTHAMTTYLATVWRFRYFWMSLVRMDLRTRYRRSLLGIGWSLLQPIAMTAIFCLVFQQMMGASSAEYVPQRH